MLRVKVLRWCCGLIGLRRPENVVEEDEGEASAVEKEGDLLVFEGSEEVEYVVDLLGFLGEAVCDEGVGDYRLAEDEDAVEGCVVVAYVEVAVEVAAEEIDVHNEPPDARLLFD